MTSATLESVDLAERNRVTADELAGPAIRSVRRSGLIAAALFTVIVGLAAFVPIASGTLASGQLAVEGERKVVQHSMGGIVSAILVKEGDTVSEGQVVLRLDPVQAGAAASLVNTQIDSLRAEAAVREAEAAGSASVVFPKELTDRRAEPGVAKLMAAEASAFKARRILASSQQQQLDTQLTQTEASLAAAKSDQASQQAQAVLLKDEIDTLKPLLEKGLALRSRVLGLQRQMEEANGRTSSLAAEQQRLFAKAAETRSLRARVEIDRRSEASEALRKVRADLSEALDRQPATADTLQRTEVRAPIAGTVMALRTNTVGGVIENGQPLMEIVPKGQGLVVRARVKPADADDVRQGLSATIRFTAAGHRSPPRARGAVQSISADALSDSHTGEPYFEVRIAITDAEVARVPRELLAPGLPAEVLISTGSQTMLEYLFSPIERAMFQGMRDK